MLLFGVAGIRKAGSSTEPKIAIWFYEVGVWAFFFSARLIKKGLNFFLRLQPDHRFTTIISVRVNHCEFDATTRLVMYCHQFLLLSASKSAAHNKSAA